MKLGLKTTLGLNIMLGTFTRWLIYILTLNQWFWTMPPCQSAVKVPYKSRFVTGDKSTTSAAQVLSNTCLKLVTVYFNF